MAEPQQDQCKAHDVVSGAFAGVQQGQLPKCSVPGSRCWLKPVITGYEHGQRIAPFRAGPGIWAQGCLSLLAHWKNLALFSALTKTCLEKHLLRP